MRNFKSKLIFLLIVLVAILGLMQMKVYATNDNIEIVEQSNGEYLIYIKDHLNTDFEFTISNIPVADKATLVGWRDAGTDGTGNNVAFIDNSTIGLFGGGNTAYLWARLIADPSTYIVDGITVDLSLAIEENKLDLASNLTRLIDVDLTQKATTVTTAGDKEIRITVGKIVLTDQGDDYYYQIASLQNTTMYDNLLNLVETIKGFTATSPDMYTKVKGYRELYNIYYNLVASLGSWEKVEGNEIHQPEDAENGYRYLVWIYNEATGEIDLQIMKSTKAYAEEKIIETITTKLPVTYDNNVLLIILGILVVAIVVVCVLYKASQKKEKEA